MAQEKIRIYALAKQLDLESSDLVKLCQKHGIDVKNQLSSLDPEQRDMIVELLRRGGPASGSTAKPAASAAPLPKGIKEIRTLEPGRKAAASRDFKAEEAARAQEALEAGEPEQVAEHVADEETTPETPVPAVRSEPVGPMAAEVAAPPTLPPSPEAVPPLAPAASATPSRGAEPPAAPTKPGESPAAPRSTAPASPAEPTRAPSGPPTHRPMRNLGGTARPSDSGTRSPERRPQPAVPPAARPVPGGRQFGQMPTPAPKKPVAEEKKPPPPSGPKKIGVIPKEMMDSNKPIRIEDLLRPINRPATTVPVVPGDIDDDEDGDRKDKNKKTPGSGVAGRDQRHAARNQRARERQARQEAVGKGLLVDDSEGPKVKTLVHIKRRRQQQATMPRKGKVPISLPITVRSLSEAMGLQSGKLLFQLMSHGAPATLNINSSLDPDLAEALALEQGCELDIKRPLDAEEELRKERSQPDDPDMLETRAPIVTIMGHVDHGKTSLLDRIRRSNIVDTEAGGITQSIRAWRVEHNGRAITFLDTPGHEAFTKMRARGANVTDIAVIVVAADDGVMPQTEEAISHAKAAGVAIVVALNKIDVPNANIRKAEQQLYSLNLLPDNMGGDVPFVHTSAVSGKGIEELLEAILLVADVQLEQKLKANPNKLASGTCLEATVSGGEGVYATLLVQDGTLNKGDVLLCGASYGRVRALYSDLGQPIDEAGPSVPCRVTGLDEIPNADDPFMVVEDLAVAREIAEKRQAKLQEALLIQREPMKLEALLETKATELKIILKADVRGSVEAIKKELEKLQHDEVKVRILHTAIGGINESDVALAMISPQDTIIVGFNVVPDDSARTLAESRGIQIREYNIIYKLTDDIRAALEGKLKPREEIVPLGRAVVRETFKISRTGTIAGCRVTQGAIERSGKIRVIRNGAVVYPPPDRTVGLDSLKRFKEDAKEVQQGYECGLKITGYDDVKVDDIIECYKIEQVQRTLS